MNLNIVDHVLGQTNEIKLNDVLLDVVNWQSGQNGLIALLCVTEDAKNEIDIVLKTIWL